MSHLFGLLVMPMLMCGPTGLTAASANPVLDTSYPMVGVNVCIIIDAPPRQGLGRLHHYDGLS
jgi:hypothetical protein